MSSENPPVFHFGNQPGAQANGAAQPVEELPAIDPPAPELLATQHAQNATAAQPSAAATPQYQQPATSSQQPQPQPDVGATLSAEAENRIVERLMSTLQTLGITQQQPATPAASISQPEAQPQPAPTPREAERDPWVDWQDPWSQEGWS